MEATEMSRVAIDLFDEIFQIDRYVKGPNSIFSSKSPTFLDTELQSYKDLGSVCNYDFR